MLTERSGLKLDDGTIETITVEEILKAYDIYGLSLEDLQEKYVDMVDDYTDRIYELENNQEDLNSNINDLQETVSELSTKIENINNNPYIENNSSYTGYFLIVFSVGVIIAFFIGKYFNKNK